MVVQDFLDYINKFNFVHTCGVYDIFDRCVYILTFSIILVCSATITIKSYILDPMSCYVPTTISGANFVPYVNNYCWIIGTIAKGVHESNTDDEDYWKAMESRRINYYQWVPLVLGLQAALLYIPYVLWECMIYNRLGTNLQFIIDMARRASLDYGESRRRKISQMAGSIFALLASRKRKCEKSYHGLLSRIPFYKMEIFFFYLSLKLTSIALILSQFVIMERFLNMHGRYRLFGVTLLHDLINGKHWDKTNLFPRMAFCRVPFKIHNNPPMNLQAQCSLSINILNEKIFIFLWWWFSFMAVLQIVACVLWMYRCLPRRNRINLLEYSLLVHKSYVQYSPVFLKDFDGDLLSVDGSFLIHMTRLNCGDLICIELIQQLLQLYNAHPASVHKRQIDSVSFNSDTTGKDFGHTDFI